jgi:predicted peptidase
MTALQYLLYPPSGTASGERAPLFIFLHGSGERGSDLALVKKWGLPKYLDQGNRLPAYVVAPQCPSEELRWNDVLDDLEQLLEELLRAHPIDEDRVLLTGFSMGGFGTWQWALRSPEHFAALMPVGGSGFKYGSYFAGDDLCPLKTMPIWMFHGALDEVVPVSGADEFAGLLLQCGANIGYTRYPHARHVLTSDFAYGDKTHYDWLLQQKRQKSS